jgi:fructokinase
VIVVCGEALIDRIRQPDATQRDVPGGGPFNTARALARLGVPTAFLGHLSTDAFGRELAALLSTDGVSLALATQGPEPTTVALADVDSRGLARYEFQVEATSAPSLTQAMIPLDLGPHVSAIHLGTLGLALEPMADTLIALAARERGRRMLMLDPNVRVGLVPDDVYRERLSWAVRASTLVKASEADLAWLYPGLGYEKAAGRILDQGVSMAVVTLGAEGAFGAHRDIRLLVAAPHVHVVDTIGAGDAFGAALLAWLHEHDRVGAQLEMDVREVRAALEFACMVAATTCTRAGADPPFRTELVPP